MRPSGTPQELEQRRLRAVRLLGEGFSPVEVARQIGVDRRSVRRWKAAARDGGTAAVAAKPASGRPRRLTRRDLTRLRRMLIQGAQAVGLPTDLWTCPRVSLADSAPLRRALSPGACQSPAAWPGVLTPEAHATRRGAR